METMGQRLGDALRARGLEPPDLIRGTRLSKGTIYNILNDTTQPEKVWADTLGKVCGFLRISRDWLQWGKGERDAAEPADDPTWANVLGYSQAVGLGEGVEAQEYAETHKLKFRAESLARKGLAPGGLGVVYGKGDSMLPRIHPGDAILFDIADTRPKDETLFVVMTQGVGGSAYSVKRCRHFGDDVYFDALNPEGDHQWRKPRKVNDKGNPITIIGRVRWIGSWED